MRSCTRLNAALGNVGRTLVYTNPLEAEPVDQVESLKDLVADMQAGRVGALVIIGGNPVYTAPADIPFVDGLNKVALRIHLSQYDDETSALCHWHVPEAHFLEAWSDARGYDGTASIVQPLIAPLYGGRSAHELLAAMSDRPDRSAYDVVRDQWRPQTTAAEFDLAWRRWLHDGVIPGTAFPEITVSAKQSPEQAPAAPSPARGGLQIAFVTIPRCSTAASPTTAGCRSCRSRSPGSRGTTPCS